MSQQAWMEKTGYRMETLSNKEWFDARLSVMKVMLTELLDMKVPIIIVWLKEG